MNIVFFGSSRFAVPSLEALLETGHKISCVVTQPDRKKGRGLAVSATEIKIVAQKAGLLIYQPEKLNTAEATKFLKDLKPDLFIVIAYGQILPEKILEIPKLLALNLHASLLPKYRGASPINWALINGETTTGISVIKMVEELDAGEVILQKNMEIDPADNASTLGDKLAHLAKDALLETLGLLENRTYKLLPQDVKEASFAPRLKKEDGCINWLKSARDICNLIRGAWGWPEAFTHYQGRLLKIHKAEVAFSSTSEAGFCVGEVIKVEKNGLTVKTAEDNLVIKELQPEGKRKMNVAEFIAGHKVCPGERLG